MTFTSFWHEVFMWTWKKSHKTFFALTHSTQTLYRHLHPSFKSDNHLDVIPLNSHTLNRLISGTSIPKSIDITLEISLTGEKEWGITIAHLKINHRQVETVKLKTRDRALPQKSRKKPFWESQSINVYNISIGTISLVDGYMEWTLHTFAQEVESSIDKSKMTVGSAWSGGGATPLWSLWWRLLNILPIPSLKSILL